MVREKGEQAHLKSAVQWRVVCAAFGKDESLPKKNLLILSHPIGWIVGAMIYFTGEVSGSSPGWSSCAREKNIRSI
ncbi:hypothetical protein KSP40_PGU004265 [Platanthera guangdongensis]|uniref:Uncharacterized protein n=1 Tax=Platanthera guangdongensis TaxID=2320717 RepID=A0ABR2LCY8_9ASPA